MIKINSNNAAVRALAAKNLLENRLIAAIDAGRMREAEQIAGELQRLGLLPSPAVIAMIRAVVQDEERVAERRARRAAKRRVA